MNIETKYPNSAGRLLAVIQELSTKGAYEKVLPEFFYPNEKKHFGKNTEIRRMYTMKALGELHILYSQFQEDMMNSDTNENQKKVLMNGLRDLSGTIYPPGLAHGIQALSEAQASLLEVCATGLGEELVPSEEELGTIRESTESLRELVASSELDPALRKILLELIRISRDSIDRYTLHGADGLKKAFKTMIGELSELHFTKSEKEKELIRKSDAWKAMMTHLQKFDQLASRILKYKPMLEQAMQLVLGT